VVINPVEVVRKKRDGIALDKEEILEFIRGAVSGTIPEYQVSAWLMATYFQGMALDETQALTEAMIASGRRVTFTDAHPKVDKHSTGGVGDKVSIILAPLVASLGVHVPMVAGRGLAHTGGTLDKLESIPGFSVSLSIEKFIEQVQTCGTAIMGQSKDFVPADKLLYALRDVTATVECVPLITASILSKKAAEGISGLVLDLKVGNGAFMKSQKDAERLARSIVAVGKGLGLKVRVLITDMNQPLGLTAGHSIEILECIEVLSGNGPSDLRDLTIELASHMLILAGKCSALSAARTMSKRALQNGTALEKFKEMCKHQGASKDPIANPECMTLSPHTATIPAPKKGHVSKINTEALGLLLAATGGGRQKVTDTIDKSVGLRLHTKIGDTVNKGDPLMTVYYNPEKLTTSGIDLTDFSIQLAQCYSITASRVSSPKLIKKVIES